MAKTFKQTVSLNTSASKAYALYMDSQLHTEVTGEKAKMSDELGGRYTAGNGYIRGKNLLLKKNKMVVQTWRGKDWSKDIPDSIVVLDFSATEGGTTSVNLFHSNVPDEAVDGIKKGWQEYYWKRWKQHVKSGSADPTSSKAKTTSKQTTPKKKQSGKTTQSRKTKSGTKKSTASKSSATQA